MQKFIITNFDENNYVAFGEEKKEQKKSAFSTLFFVT